MKNDKTSLPFQMMALTVPAVEAAVGKNWLPTLVLALAAFLLCTWMSAQPEPEWKWLYPVRCVAIVFLLAWLLNWTHTCWPGEKASYVVPGALLILAIYAVWKGSAIGASTVLRYGMYLIFGLLAVLGIPQVKLDSLRPTAQLPDMRLAAVLLLPLLARKNGTWRFNPIGAAALLAAILTGGSASVYEYSRGLSLGGVTEHMESLAACAITVGNFSLLCFLLDGIEQKGERNWQVWAIGLAAYGLYAVGAGFRPEVYVLLILVLWGVFPALWTMKENVMKKEKSA
ncbi:MAG: hypothetical protein ACI3XG_02175 [Faecousia sp.]